MKISSKPLLAMLVGALTVVAPSIASAEDNWPSRPITLVIPYAAGGFADTRMRMLAKEVGEELKANVVVENKAGAGGVIGTAYIAKAKPDGYTIGSGNLAPLSVNPSLMPANVSYDVQKDIAPIILVEESPLILNVNNAVPVQNVQELIELAKKEPGAFRFGSSGVGGAHHLSGHPTLAHSSAGLPVCADTDNFRPENVRRHRLRFRRRRIRTDDSDIHPLIRPRRRQRNGRRQPHLQQLRHDRPRRHDPDHRRAGIGACV